MAERDAATVCDSCETILPDAAPPTHATSSLPPRPCGDSSSAAAVPPPLPPVERAPQPPERLEAAGGVAEVAESLAPFAPAMCCPDARWSRQLHDWTCGHVNLASIMSTLIARGLAERAGTADGAPGVRLVQQLVEGAWREGLDAEGAVLHGGALVGKRGRKAWLGAVDALIAMWHVRVESFMVEIVARDGAGDAVHAVGAACFAASAAADVAESEDEDGRGRKRRKHPVHCSRRLPLLLQHQGHSRLLVGVLTRPPRVVLYDPADPPNRLRCLAPAALNGRQYQLLCCGEAAPEGGGRLHLSEAALARRKDGLQGAAAWDRGAWRYAPWCTLRFR